jgi:phosphatidate cytidylyltransferase
MNAPAVESRGKLSELTRRILVAIVAVPITAGAVIAGGIPMALLVAVASGVAAWELYRMARATGAQPMEAVGIPLAVAWPLIIATEPRGVFIFPPGLLAAIGLVVLSAAIWVRGVSGRPLESVATTLFGIGYSGGLLSFGFGIRYHRFVADDRGGAALLLLPVLMTWGTDIGAYAFGRLYGQRKLIPSVSPGKTVIGAIGGLAGSVAVCWVYVVAVLMPVAELGMTRIGLLGLAVAVSVAAQVGDLAESLLKREAGVKNSSGILPGHGGLLDRIDSLVFVLPVAYVIFNLPGFLLPVPGTGHP